MIKKNIFTPLSISFLLLFTFMAFYLYQKLKPDTIHSTKLIVKSIDGFCFDQTCLQKKDGLWWYQDQFPADSQKVDDFVSTLETIKLDSLVSNNPQNFEQLGFYEDNLFLIKVGEISFYFSSPLQDTSHSLIKLVELDQVYKINYLGTDSDLFDPVFWKKEYLVNLPSYQIQKISVNNQDRSIDLDKQSDNWPDQDYIDLLSYLPIQDFLAPQPSESSLVYQISLTLEEGDSYKISFGAEDHQYWTSLDDKFYYQIDKINFDKLTSILF